MRFKRGANYILFILILLLSCVSVSALTPGILEDTSLPPIDPPVFELDDIPYFANMSDNGPATVGTGLGIFHTNITNTNGTVYLFINGLNLSTTNDSSYYTATYTFPKAQTYTYQWIAVGTDLNETVSHSDERTYVVNTGKTGGNTGGGGSSGGGGGAPAAVSSSTSYRNTYVDVKANDIIAVELPTDSEIAITNMNLELTDDVAYTSVELRVSSQPSGAEKLENVESVVSVSVTKGVAQLIDQVSLEFKVLKENENGITQGNAVANGYTGSKWNEYDLVYKSMDDTYYYYTLDAPYHEHWAIVKKEVTQATVVKEEATPTTELNPTQEAAIEQEILNQPTQKTSDINQIFEAMKPYNIAIIASIGIFIVLFIIVFALLSHKNHSVHEKEAKEKPKRVVFETKPAAAPASLVAYIRKAQLAGYSDQQIQLKLLDTGWKQPQIDVGMIKAQKAAAVQPKLQKYISDSFAKGATPDAIKQKLITTGWDETLVLNALANYDKKTK